MEEQQPQGRLIRLEPAEHAAARRHRLTASRAADLMTGSYRVWNRLAWDMRGEQRILGQKSGVPALDWGIEHERQVLAWVWERHADWDIERGGLLLHHDREHPLFSRFCACSPDGVRIADETWGIEVKAPFNPEIHLRYVRSGRVPEEYDAQIQFSLWCSGYPRWLFVTGDPRFDDNRYMELAVEPDPVYQARLTELATEFLEGYSAGDEFKPRQPSAANFDKMF